MTGMFSTAIHLPNLNEKTAIYPPNLKELVLQYLTDFPALWLEPLLRSCPLLESLTLYVRPSTNGVEFPDPQPLTVTMSCPSLKSLDLSFINSSQSMTIFIDAPKLSNLAIVDNTTFYHFTTPTILNNARLNLRRHFFDGELYYRKRPSILPNHQHYLHQMSTFFRGMNSVTHLELHLDPCTNFFTTLTLGPSLPIFHNLIRFTATLVDIGLNAWTHLLPSLHCFPFLKDLHVVLLRYYIDIPIDEWNWCPPHPDSTYSSLPHCFVSHLKTITISGFPGADADLQFLAYILTSALVLEELHVNVDFNFQPYPGNEVDQVLLDKQHKFCSSLFNLPRSSSSCKVVFSGPSITTSSVIPHEKGRDTDNSRGNWTE